MDPRLSAQDLIRCDLCETAVVQMYCDFCHVKLCKPCIGEHIAEEYNKHQIVPFQQRKSTLIYPKCTTHPTKTCELQCKECDIPICALCSVSESHKRHSMSNLFEIYNTKRQTIEKDLQDIESIISPTYEEIATGTEIQIENLEREYEKLTTAVKNHGEECHKEIDNIVNKLTTEIKEMKIKHKAILKKHLEEIKQIQSVIEQTLLSLKKVEESNEILVSMAIEYKSKNQEFCNLPPKVLVSLPIFSPKTIDTEQHYKLFGSLIPLSTTTEENGYKLKKPETPARELLEEPELITTINTNYKELRSVACLSEEEIWTSGVDSDMKCLNIQGSLIKTIGTKTGEWPYDIAVTIDGALVYSDWERKTINKVKNGQTVEMIRLQGWRPLQLCVTSSGDLLITMYRDDYFLVSIFPRPRSKVVRYSGFTEKQTIQFDEEGKPLYSGNNTTKCISENRNLDICVADREAGAVVVVNQAGRLRFRYTGHPSATKNKPFKPRNITTDSQSQILTADRDNHCIHILDQDGQFLRYIDNCGLREPFGLCVDKKDNLFVAEWSGKLKKIKYLR
ncbi:tripartite motif-containing protein 55-like [Saccostrea cucullata]|uniref:tripartite motif-containing protein 55-like n=1 Tax=Saccostrea cuccullata TaxID=36930 RepID=UPI002ED0CEFA